MKDFLITVTAASGVETVTARELNNLGIEAKFLQGRATFKGDFAMLVKCSLCLRTADRVLINLGSFPAFDFDSLYDGIRRLPLGNFIDKNGSFPVVAKSVQSKLAAYSAIQSVAKKSAVENLARFHKAGKLPETGARYKLEVSIYKDIATVCLDSSGEGLHKRGYRDLSAEAPLKETLAAAMIMISVWKPDLAFCDPFCGSGTLPIEAAMLALNIAPGLLRDFDFLHWKCFPQEVFKQVKEEAESEIKRDVNLRIYGFDIDEKVISMALRHARTAGVAEHIHFQRQDVSDFSSRFARGVIVTNPPYGERLSDRIEVAELYKKFGKMFFSLDEWNCYTLTSFSDFERFFGKRADKKRKLYNANLECNLYQYLSKVSK